MFIADTCTELLANWWRKTHLFLDQKVSSYVYFRGILDYKAPVCRYWPEFAQNGKQDITLETLVTNQVIYTRHVPYVSIHLHLLRRTYVKVAPIIPYKTIGSEIFLYSRC